MKKGLTEVIIILDRSGSMERIWPDAVGGLTRFIEEQKKLPGELRLTLHVFDTELDRIYDAVDLRAVPQDNVFGLYPVYPRGTTALLDAIGFTFTGVGKRLADTPDGERPERVLVAIITDGEENASREFSRRQIQKMIRHQERKYDWFVTYLGANVDAFAEASDLGLDTANAINFGASARGIDGAYALLCETTCDMRQEGISGTRSRSMQQRMTDCHLDLDTDRNDRPSHPRRKATTH